MNVAQPYVLGVVVDLGRLYVEGPGVALDFGALVPSTQYPLSLTWSPETSRLTVSVGASTQNADPQVLQGQDPEIEVGAADVQNGNGGAFFLDDVTLDVK